MTARSSRATAMTSWRWRRTRPRALLATGDYEGKIIVWNLFSGEKRCSLRHTSTPCAPLAAQVCCGLPCACTSLT